MKKIIIIIFSIIFLAGCNVNKVNLNTKLEQSIQSGEKKEKIKIDLHTLTDFDWDKAYIFEPYTDQETIDKQLGVHFKDPSNMKMRDDIYLIVFIQDNKVVQYAEIKSKYGSISMGKREYLTPNDATIEITDIGF